MNLKEKEATSARQLRRNHNATVKRGRKIRRLKGQSSMLIASTPSPEMLTLIRPVVQRNGGRLTGFLFWFIAMVLVFVVPLALVLGAVFVSSWGIPLPLEVRVP